ncbi:MAG: glycosyltransferase, partial [Bdellovibrionales bacterium]|nr:glycosyltransferase [Bdellovibrionales bacterium]
PFNAAVSTILWLTRRGKKIAMDWDDLWGDGYGLYLGSFINKILKAQETWLPKIIHPEFMTTASHELYNRSLKIGLPMERVHILINGCDPKKISAHSRSDARHNLSFDSESTYVISIGNTYSEKSFNQMLQAFRLALSKNSKIKLLLLGDFSKFGTLGKIIENIKTENSDLFAKSIITPGLVSLKTMNMYLDASDFAILPMEDTPIDHARFPIRFGDYLSASKLIISNAVGEIARILNEEKIGLVSSPEDAQAFAQNILKAAEHMKTDNNFLFKMQQIQTKYSWKTLSIKLDTLYNKSLGTQYDETVEIKRAA